MEGKTTHVGPTDRDSQRGGRTDKSEKDPRISDSTERPPQFKMKEERMGRQLEKKRGLNFACSTMKRRQRGGGHSIKMAA